MTEHKTSRWSVWAISLLLIVQMGIFSLRLNDPFIDGRFHINWGPAFWLENAAIMHQANFFRSYLGVVDEVQQKPEGPRATSWYSSHPQLIAIPLYIWTGLFGYREWVIRSLSSLLILVATYIFWRAVRVRHTEKQAFIATAFFALLPVLIQFSGKLDQEQVVLVVLSGALLGFERFMAGREQKPWTWTIMCALLLWADWSGFIFVGLFTAAALLFGRTHEKTKQLAQWTFLGGAIGAMIVGMQTFLEMRSRGDVIKSFVSLYKYRSGTSQPGFWFLWLQKQIGFFGINFAYILGAIGVVPIISRVVHTIRYRVTELREGISFLHVTGLIGVGTLAYALVVPQATAIHFYYQMYYVFPVAYGIMVAYEWFVRWLQRHGQQTVIAGVLCVLALVWSTYQGISYLYVDVESGWGTIAEIDLLQFTKARIDRTDSFVFLGGKDFNAWLDNPNIRYYAGRAIPIVEDPREAVKANWIMFGNSPTGETNQQIGQLNDLVKPTHLFKMIHCTTLLCVVQKVAK